MAFADALRPADGGTVVLNVDTSQTAKLEQAEAQWRESVGQMSREALKLDLAQDRLRKSLASYGAESAQAKRATIALKDAEEAAARAADRHAREVRELDRAQGRARISGRGLVASVTGLAGAYFGAQGLINATRTALSASSNLAEQQDFARRIFGASTRVVQEYADKALGLARDQAFEAAAGIGSLIKPLVGSAEESARLSVQLTKLGVDLASIKNARVEDTLTAIRAGLVGETEPLRRYAVLLNAAKVEQEALRQTGKASAAQLTEGEKVLARVALILREAAYAQGNYADTISSSANQEREAQKNFRNTAILIGDTLQPAYRELLRRVNEYLGSAENQRRIQEQVNRAVETGEDVVRGIAGALENVHDRLGPVVDLLGGLDRVIETALVLGIIGKGARAAAAVRGLATSFSLVGPAAMRAQTTATGALSGIGAAAAGAQRQVGGLRGALRGLAGLGPIAVSIALTQPDEVPSAGGARKGLTRIDDFEGLLRMARDGRLPEKTIRKLEELGEITPRQAAQLRQASGRRGPGDFASPDTMDPQGPGRGPAAPPRPPAPDLPPRPDRDPARAVEENTRREEERRRREDERLRRALEEADRAAARAAERRHRLLGGLPSNAAEMRRAALRHLNAARREGERALTEAEFRRLSFDLIRGLNSLREFGSNFAPGGGSQTDTNTWTIAQLTRAQNQLLGTHVRGSWHPAARQAQAELG
ncbi:MAG TPA: hypothetical protein VNI83_05835, partial [Vicinamibacterales bacterium]|nr:hypothetical protein [Vicinamibacterales bacterium]